MAAIYILGKNKLFKRFLILNQIQWAWAIRIGCQTVFYPIGTYDEGDGLEGVIVTKLEIISLRFGYRQKYQPYTPIPHRPRIPRIDTKWQIFGFVAESYSVREGLNWFAQSVVSSCNS